jgi:hypothetical protein
MRRVDSSGSGYGPVANFCERSGNTLKAEEPSVSPEDFLLFWSYKTAYGNSF